MQKQTRRIYTMNCSIILPLVFIYLKTVIFIHELVSNPTNYNIVFSVGYAH